MSTVNKPHLPLGSEPSRDDDPTGVRALLSSLRQPDPMPAHLVERINASLAAEQSQRAARGLGPAVTPLLAASRRRPRKLLFALAGAAAAVAVVAVVGGNLLLPGPPTTTSVSSALDTPALNQASGGEALSNTTVPTAAARKLSSQAQPSADSSAGESSGGEPTPPVQILHSGTRYTHVGFVTQAGILRTATLSAAQLGAVSRVGPAGTTAGLIECLRTIGAGQAQVVRADVASYEGRQAVILVATTDSVAMGYVVGPECSPANPAVLRPATPLP